ncbi:class A beta-lactamase-related serine hydrolase [Streptomyces sp. Z26]|nr:class A beta-lactamase-related serine hydrolase [Streptomyces sp. Z26]
MAYARLRHAASPERAGLRVAELTGLTADIDALPGTWCSGAVVLAGRGPYVAVEHAAGWAVRYGAYDPESGLGVELPREEWVPARTDTVFDLASLTKLFTAVAVQQQVERGALELDRPITDYVTGASGAPGAAGAGGPRGPRGALGGRSRMPRLRVPGRRPPGLRVPEGAVPEHGLTLRHLLTHTSGLRPELPLYDHEPKTRVARVWAEEPLTAPGDGYRYSDLNLLLAQSVLELVTGQPLDALIREGITRPLGMTRTRFRPPRGWRARTAATEDQRRPWAKLDRGMLRGHVHDENAYALNGVAGHAGLFSTAGDLAVLCRTLLTGGAYGPARILAPSSVAALLAPPGLGFAVGQPWFMGELAGGGTETGGGTGAVTEPGAGTAGERPRGGGRAAGHTGFTGTSLVLDPVTDTFLVLLANTVHPVRRAPDSRPRADAATRLARAVR